MGKTKSKFLRPRWRKVLADLWEGRTRTILVVASIAVGVFAIGGIATCYAILSEDLDASYAAIHPANIEMVTAPFDEDFLRAVERIPGVAELDANGRCYMPSHTNFVMIHVGRDVTPVIEAFKQRGILVERRFATLPEWLRVSLGTQPEIEAFVAALRAIVPARAQAA